MSQLALMGKRVTVMGLGVHGGGVGVARFLVREGATVLVTDLKTESELASSLKILAGLPITYILGRHREEDFRDADLVIVNPAVPTDSPYLEIARRQGVAIDSDIGLFVARSPAPIIGVTGTRGKSTTAALIAAMLDRRFPSVVLAGNIRSSPLELLPTITKESKVVLELSSWQLGLLAPRRWSPSIAIVTSIYPDHLNRYASMEAYLEDKKVIYRFQREGGIFITSKDQEVTCAMGEEAGDRTRWVSLREVTNGAYLTDDKLFFAAPSAQLLVQRRELKLIGLHNAQNALMAAVAASAAGVSLEDIRATLRSFPGLPDRLEVIAEVGGVRYINDTTATSPEGAIAALSALIEKPYTTRDKAPILLIAGGADKGLRYETMVEALFGRVRELFLFQGAASDKIEAALRTKTDPRVPLLSSDFTSMEEVFTKLAHSIQRGDIVLLSPGAASFGIFQNEFDRGEQFRAFVRTLAQG